MRFFFAKKLPNAQARGRRCVCGQCDGNGGVQAAAARRLLMDQVDRMDLMDKMGAPVFALTGYAVASHGIPRGFAERSLVWRG